MTWRWAYEGGVLENGAGGGCLRGGVGSEDGPAQEAETPNT